MDMNQSVIGNKRTKETHIPSCGCLQLMNKENMIGFSSLQLALSRGFDTCGHCLESHRPPQDREPTRGQETQNQFCVFLNGTDYCGNVIGERPRSEILTLRAKIISDDDPAATEDLAIKFTVLPDGVTEEVIATEVTNQQGIAQTTYDPINLPQGSTEFRAYFPDGTRSIMYIEFLPSIRNARVSPDKFKRSTKIIFDLLEDSVINISIYKNTNFSGWASHRKTIRCYADGVMQKGNGKSVRWDGTNDRNKQTWRGSYVARLETPKDFVYHDANGNVLSMRKTRGKL